MASSKPFFTDGMSIEDIMNLSADTLRGLDQRDLSRAVRTLALAGNKRINRLLAQSKKTKQGYELKKSAKYNVALDALNYITDDGKKKPGFSAKGKSLNELRAEFNKAKSFLQLQTSTISGAKQVRKEREKRVLGKTSEDYLKESKKKMKEFLGKKPTLKDLKQLEKTIREEYQKASKSAYATFRKFNEMQGISNNPYRNYEGSDELLEMIGQRTLAGEDEADILEAVAQRYEEMYVHSIENIISDDDDPFTLIFDEE